MKETGTVRGTTILAEVLGGGNRELGQAIVTKVRAWLGLKAHDEGGGVALPAFAAFGADHETPGTDQDEPLVALDQINALPLQPRFGGRFYEGMLALARAPSTAPSGR